MRWDQPGQQRPPTHVSPSCTHMARRGRRLACELPALPSSPETELSGPVSARSGPEVRLMLGRGPYLPVTTVPPAHPAASSASLTLCSVFHPLDDAFPSPAPRGGLPAAWRLVSSVPSQHRGLRAGRPGQLCLSAQSTDFVDCIEVFSLQNSRLTQANQLHASNYKK